MFRSVFPRLAATAFCLSAALVLAGCSLPKIPPPNKRYYNITAARPESLPANPRQCVLKVRPLDISPGFEDTEFVYRLSDAEFESDYYNLFLVPPAWGITGQTRSWLRDSGLFSSVMEEGTIVNADLALEGAVTSLYGNFVNRAAPKAVMEIQFFLLENRIENYPVLFQKTYRREVPFSFSGKDASELVAAMNKGLTEILTELEEDLRAVDPASKITGNKLRSNTPGPAATLGSAAGNALFPLMKTISR